jgi:hypothetical protein
MIFDFKLLDWSRSDVRTSVIVKMDRECLVLWIGHITPRPIIIIPSAIKLPFPPVTTSFTNHP